MRQFGFTLESPCPPLRGRGTGGEASEGTPPPPPNVLGPSPVSMNVAGTDSRLVARALAGETRAFEELVRRHLRSAHAVALGVLGNPADAEDVCQDAFLTALEKLEEC